MVSFVKSAVFVSVSATAITAPAQAQIAKDAVNAWSGPMRLAAHVGLQAMRNVVDLTYERVLIDPETGTLALSGLEIYPNAGRGSIGECRIAIDQVVIDAKPNFEQFSGILELTGLRTEDPDCFPSEVRQELAEFGYDNISFDTLALEFSYHWADSSAEIYVEASMPDAARINLGAEFDYFWLKFPDEDVGPVASLAGLEVSIEDEGLLERVKPMLTEQFGSLDVLVPMMEVGIAAAMGTGLGPAETAFLRSVSRHLPRFLRDGGTIAATVIPNEPVWLNESLFDSLASLIGTLQPVLSGAPLSARTIVPPDELTAALAAEAEPDEATRLRVGSALLTGLGAPRSIEDGTRLLLPLARNWSGAAASLLSTSHEASGRDLDAYEMALVAMSGGHAEAAFIANRIEARIPLAEILEIQSDMRETWPGAQDFNTEYSNAVAAGDVGTIRRLANAAANGDDQPRSYVDAYMLATLAAAGGDRRARGLRDRFDRKFSGKPEWQELANEASELARREWTDGGLGAAIADKLR